jgi:hypothetical protein
MTQPHGPRFFVRPSQYLNEFYICRPFKRKELPPELRAFWAITLAIRHAALVAKGEAKRTECGPKAFAA